MYRLSKQFTFAMGHRLSCHQGACKNLHGHNYTVEVGIKSGTLNKDGMLMDFSNLKAVVEGFLGYMDHALMVNETDGDLIKKMQEIIPSLKIIETPFEPTAENMAEEIYKHVGDILTKSYSVQMDYVTIWETDTSCATYSED
jgi:6-pyruvoyltetrahydropterin/6-carboxytetrahydropterin synthase